MSGSTKGKLNRRQLVGIIVLIAITVAIVITMILCRRPTVNVTAVPIPASTPIEATVSDSVQTDSVMVGKRLRRRLRQKAAEKSKSKSKLRQPHARDYGLEPDRE